MNKKGDMFQLLFLLIILFISTIVGLIFLGLTLEVTSLYNSTGMLEDTAIGTEANTLMETTAPYTTDYMIFFLFIGGIVGVCVSAIRTNFSPTIVMLFVFLLLITIFVAGGFVNIYQGFTDTEALSVAAGHLTLTNFIFSKYTPLIFAILGGLVMLLMWGKSGGDIIT